MRARARKGAVRELLKETDGAVRAATAAGTVYGDRKRGENARESMARTASQLLLLHMWQQFAAHEGPR
eukprot:5832817-Pleurochrysis_carterae.AAC.1